MWQRPARYSRCNVTLHAPPDRRYHGARYLPPTHLGDSEVKLIYRTLCSAALLSGCSAAIAQDQDFSKVKIETQQLAPNLYMLMAAGGGDVKFVINTHYHGDHTGGNEPFGKAGAVIIAQDNVRARMSTEQFMAAFNRKIPPSPAAALPTITFPTRATFYWNGNKVNAFHVENAHTDGDSVIHFTNANVIHTGDTYVKDQYPLIDRGSKGSLDGFIKASEAVLALADANTKIIPGHGALANKGDLQRFHDMLVTVRGNLKTLIDQGKTEDQAVAAKPTAQLDAQWGKGFMKADDFVHAAYESLKR
jgi:cyclase